MLELTPTPPANEFVDAEFVASGRAQDEFPLRVSSCLSCGHAQLPVVVDPDRLFRNYVYVSGTSPVFVDHFRRYAASVSERFGVRSGDLVVEVGSNDGTLLRFFKEAGARVLGVDPARSIARAATESGIPTVPDFLTPSLAARIREEHGAAKLVLANNVFAHSDSLGEMADSVRVLLSSGGAFCFEVSYLPDVVRGSLFDTIYHEHLSYHHLGPLVPFFERRGLELFDAELVPTHGGSVRAFAGLPGRGPSRELGHLLGREREDGFLVPVRGFESSSDGTRPLEDLRARVDSVRAGLRSALAELRGCGKRIAGFGAPAKATTLMCHLGLGRETLEFVVDDSPLKQGLFTPGKHVPVLPVSALYERSPDAVVILAWNFARPIMEKHSGYLREGREFIVPLPELEFHGQLPPQK